MVTLPPVFALGVTEPRTTSGCAREQGEFPLIFHAGGTLCFALAEHPPGVPDCTLAPVYPEASNVDGDREERHVLQRPVLVPGLPSRVAWGTCSQGPHFISGETVGDLEIISDPVLRRTPPEETSREHVPSLFLG